MPVNADALGINTCDHALVQKVSAGRKSEPVAPLLNSDGSFNKGATLGDDGDFTLEGRGDLGLAFDDDPEIDLLSGVVIITDIEESEDAKDWNAWTVAGRFFPHAE